MNMKRENLNKENFWNSLQEQFPKSMKEFCDYIDLYKKENDWNQMFSGNCRCYSHNEMPIPKFHEIPIEMQLGIVISFLMHIGQTGTIAMHTHNIFEAANLQQWLKQFFAERELHLTFNS